MTMEMDLSDEVSALSMDGASAIAGKAHLKRLRRNMAKMQQMGIPEEYEEQQQHHEQHDRPPRRPLSSEELLNDEPANNNGDELIEPFPRTYEEWKEKKKEKKSKHKSKKHSKKSSSKSKSGHSRSSSKHKGSSHEQQQMHEQLGGDGKKAPPIMEIAIQSTNFGDNTNSTTSTPASPSRRGSSQNETNSGIISYPSIASTEDTSGSQQRNFNSSLTGSGMAMGKVANRSLQSQQQQHHHHHRSSLRSSLQDTMRSVDDSQGDADSRTHMTGHSTHMTNASSVHSHGTSHITVEDMATIRTKLDRARMEEKQVLAIHERLNGEVQSAQLKAQRAKEVALQISEKLNEATAERQRLQKLFKEMQNENIKLQEKVRKVEDDEDEQGLDNMLDSMESKIKALKLKSQKSKARRASLKD